MSNTVRLTSTHGEVRYGKSLSTDFQRVADSTGEAWLAEDIDWSDRDDYPRWFVPRGERAPQDGPCWVGSVLMTHDGRVRRDVGYSEAQIAAIVEAGAVAFSAVEAQRYDDDVMRPLYIDWSAASNSDRKGTLSCSP
jgi:hypothetical protein